jgi:hypothetical protein
MMPASVLFDRMQQATTTDLEAESAPDHASGEKADHEDTEREEIPQR